MVDGKELSNLFFDIKEIPALFASGENQSQWTKPIFRSPGYPSDVKIIIYSAEVQRTEIVFVPRRMKKKRNPNVLNKIKGKNIKGKKDEWKKTRRDD